jgi:hypothetical protein
VTFKISTSACSSVTIRKRFNGISGKFILRVSLKFVDTFQFQLRSDADTVHKDLHASFFFRAEVTGWGIPQPGDSPAIPKGQRSNYGERARIYILCEHFITCFFFVCSFPFRFLSAFFRIYYYCNRSMAESKFYKRMVSNT